MTTPADLPINTGQFGYASRIIAVGKSMGMSDRDTLIAITVGLTESGLRNLANSNVPESLSIPNDGVGSDGRSVGVFQQQVGIWGTAAELMNVDNSARLFYQALAKVQNRDSMSIPAAAQTVQRSAYPDGSNYAKSETLASQIAASAGAGAPLAVSGATPGALGWLLDSSNWKRLGLFLLGAVLLYIVAIKLVVQTKAFKSGVKIAAKVI